MVTLPTELLDATKLTDHSGDMICHDVHVGRHSYKPLIMFPQASVLVHPGLGLLHVISDNN